MKKKSQYLSQTGFYKDARILKAKIRQQKLVERERFNNECRAKLFKMSDTMI